MTRAPTSAGWKAATGLIACVVSAGAAAIPTFAEVRSAHRPSDAVVVDRSGVPLPEIVIAFVERSDVAHVY